MPELLSFFLILLVSPLKSKSQLEAENAALRHQLIVLRRKVRGRVQLTNGDRLFLVLLASRSTWSSDVDRRPRAGAPSCVTTHRTLPPWTCSLFRPSILPMANKCLACLQY
jgi:hypothetical protein